MQLSGSDISQTNQTTPGTFLISMINNCWQMPT